MHAGFTAVQRRTQLAFTISEDGRKGDWECLVAKGEDCKGMGNAKGLGRCISRLALRYQGYDLEESWIQVMQKQAYSFSRQACSPPILLE